MSVLDQLRYENAIFCAALVACAVFAWIIWRLSRPGARAKPRHHAKPQRRGDRWMIGSSTYPAGRVPGLTSSQILDTLSRIGGPLPPAGHVDDTDYVLRAQTHQQCWGNPCHTHGRYTPHCLCGVDWVCEGAGRMNTADRPVPRQRDGQPYNRQDDPGRGWRS